MLHNRRRGDRRTRLLWVLLFLGGFYLSIFVWPTAWRYHQVGNTPMRTNRVTGDVEYLNLQGWQPVLPSAFDVGTPAPRPTNTPAPAADQAGTEPVAGIPAQKS